MLFTENHLYHIYNRGNNQQAIFFERDHYLLFLKNIRKFIYPSADILAWCLMPNHFHLLIHANDKTTRIVKQVPLAINALTEGIRLALSSYTKALQRQKNFTGSLFQQKTKCKCIDDGSFHYGLIAFHYVHQNPYKAGLVSKAEAWEYSSLQDYLGLRNGTLCNKELTKILLDIQPERLLEETYNIIPDAELKMIVKNE
ncbi:MAG: transposase [Chitinophagaceae bacterium]|nr:transposase [Chitinophagaceae bacterium]